MAEKNMGLDIRTIGAVKSLIKGNSSIIKSAVADWLDNNPDATTTVQDGAITEDKLDSDLIAKLNSKANVDGYYQGITSGNAEQIVSTVGIEDQVPYHFRTSGGTIDIGDRENDKIVGETVAWNQRIECDTTSDVVSTLNGITITSKPDGSIVLDGEVTSNTWLSYASPSAKLPIVHMSGTSGCKLLFSFASKHNFKYRQIGQSSQAYTLVNDNNAVVVSTGNNGDPSDARIQIQLLEGDTFNNDVVYPCMFNLTKMFGSAIADYIYGLDQSHSGDGSVYFRKLFPAPFYPYNPGELLSVEGLQSHDMTGFNQWDEEWVNGRWAGNNGVLNPAFSTYVASKNKIPILPDTTYYFTIKNNDAKTHEIVFYDANKNWISDSQSYYINGTFTTPSNAYYITFNLGGAYGSAYENDICINLHWDGERDGEYEPYVKHSYPLDDSMTLRGVPKLDSNNKLYYDGDTYEPDGTVTRRYGIVDLGSQNWSPISRDGVNYFYQLVNDMVSGSDRANTVLAKYNRMAGAPSNGFYSIGWSYLGGKTICIRDDSYSDPAAFKTAMSGVYLVYELATPTTEEAEPFSDPQIVDDWGTEEYVTDSIVPVGHVTNYQPNLRAKLEMSPDSPEGDGDYIVRQSNGENTYVPLVIPAELPANPSTDGTYSLKVTVADGTATLAWVSD